MAVVGVLVLVSSLLATAQAAAHGATLNIVQQAQASPVHKILVEALTTAGLVTTLSGTGPFTVFAPTDTAFAAALAALKIDKAALLARSDLADILKYHVLSGKVMSSDIAGSNSPVTLQGLKVLVVKAATGATFGGAKITGSDIECTNGVVHSIDAVVLPPSMNLVQTAQATPAFSILVEAVIKAGLVDTLSGTGPFTLFAPTDTAFAAALVALKIDKAALLARSDLADILKYHVLSGKIMAADLKDTQSPATVQGGKVMVNKVAGNVMYETPNRQTLGTAKVTSADLACSNGVVHTIDAVVLPPAKDPASTSVTSGSVSKHGLACVGLSIMMLAAWA